MAFLVPGSVARFADPAHRAECAVWSALAQGLDDDYYVFYSVVPPNSGREVDFLVAGPQSLVFIEVKGGRVVAERPPRANVEWRQHTAEGQKRVDPRQLWNAKHAVQDAVALAGLAGTDVKRLPGGELYVFPDTPSATLAAANAGPVKLVLGREDLPSIGERVVAIERKYAGGRRYAMHRQRIVEALASWSYSEPVELPARALVPVEWKPSAPHTTRSYHRWPLVFAIGIALAVGTWGWLPGGDDAAKPVAPANSSTAAPVPAPVPALAPPAPERPGMVRNPAPRLPNRDPLIPAFVGAGAEAAFLKAYSAATALGPDRPVEWRDGRTFGFVTLSSLSGGRCRNYRFTRNDVRPMELVTRQVCD